MDRLYNSVGYPIIPMRATCLSYSLERLHVWVNAYRPSFLQEELLSEYLENGYRWKTRQSRDLVRSLRNWPDNAYYLAIITLRNKGFFIPSVCVLEDPEVRILFPALPGFLRSSEA
jgi:hypothetical protein